LYKAQTDQLWFVKVAGDGPKEEVKAEYSFEGIARVLDSINASLFGWEVFFREMGISPLRIEYEDLCKDPQGCVSDIADRLSLTPVREFVPEEVKIKVQRTSESESWVGRFRREYLDSLKTVSDVPDLLQL
jgi:LPS sulfotransferase NodH